MAVVDDVCRSLRAGGGTNVAFVNGHGGNVGALSVMLREVRLRHGLQTCLIRPMSKVGAPSHDGVDMHAGELETSVVMALRPNLVREVSGNGRGGVPPDASGPTIPGSMGWVTSDLSQDGVIGRPQYATTGKGEQLVEHMVTYMVEEIRAFAHAVSQPGAGAPADRHRSAEDGG